MEYISIFKALDETLYDKDSKISILQYRVGNAERKVEELQAQLTTKAPVKKDGWKPLRGEEYWFFDSDGETDREINGKTIGDLALIDLGNCAPTEEELRSKELEILAALGLEKWEG